MHNPRNTQMKGRIMGGSTLLTAHEQNKMMMSSSGKFSSTAS